MKIMKEQPLWNHVVNKKNHNFGDSEKHSGQFMFVALYNVLAILISLNPLTWLSGWWEVKSKITGVGTGGKILDLILEIREEKKAGADYDIGNETVLISQIYKSA